MTDFHSHILPKMDDGSRSTEESLLMLKSLSGQGIERVVVTPHFYANDESVSDFLSRRKISFDGLNNILTEDMPKIVLGAEVRYYDGISRLQDLKSLCIKGTNLLLLEMPFSKWTEYTLRELTDISSNGNVTIVLAHIERYMKFQKADVFYRLIESGVLMQINASFINDFFTRRKAIGLLKNGDIHFLGSDTHNMNNRAPDIGSALKIIEKKLGKEFVLSLDDYVNKFFEIKI